MQLVNLDMERRGTQGILSLGPFSPGLNALCGPAGSGKTTLLHWLRQLVAEDHQRSATSSAVGWDRTSLPVSGWAEFANRGLRTQLGRRHNRHDQPPTAYSQSDLSSQQREAFVALAAASGATDTETALEEVAKRLHLHVVQPIDGYERTGLVARQREVEALLSQLPATSGSRAALLARREELQRELTTAHAQPHNKDWLGYSSYSGEHRRYEDRFALIEADLRDTMSHIEQLDRDLASQRSELKLLETSRSTVTIDDSYRQQLQQIDERLTRWRQTLRDLKGHRNRIEHDATDARLDKQVGEQLSVSKEPDPRAPLRSLESQILSARRQLDALVDRYSVFHDRRPEDPSPTRYGAERYGAERYGAERYTPGPYDRSLDQASVHRDAAGRTRIAYRDDLHYPDASQLPETLRSMQKDLYEACQQLARHESRAANETLKQQSQQLQRCESELLHSVEKLIEERASLLRKIADEYQLSADQLSLAFGNWCDCQDHQHLHDWLLNDCEVKTPQVAGDPLVRQRLLEAAAAIEEQRKQANLHVEDCRRQLRDAELRRLDVVDRQPSYRGPNVDHLQRALDGTLAELRQWDEREQLLRETDELRRQLQDLDNRPAASTNFHSAVKRHIAGLMGGRQRLASRSIGHTSPQRRYDLVDGIVYEQERRLDAEVPPMLVRTAMRLAIAELSSERAAPIPLVLDGALDSLTRDDQAVAMAHLASVAASGQQIVVLTDDEGVAEMVRQHRGWVAYLNRSSAAPVLDINQHLTAVANDYETSKWYQPIVASAPLRSSAPQRVYYLTERSRIEESPSIGNGLAARLRAVGIDRVGDLLDVDPLWLADQLRQDGVTAANVASWQAESRLLCSVRKLRPFDARLLVSIGIRTPRQLAEMHPSQLLDRVERFVSTDRGRRLLQSGSSYELSRITNWIASAKGGAGRYQRSNFNDRPSSLDSPGREPRSNGYLQPSFDSLSELPGEPSFDDGYGQRGESEHRRESPEYSDRDQSDYARRDRAQGYASRGDHQWASRALAPGDDDNGLESEDDRSRRSARRSSRRSRERSGRSQSTQRSARDYPSIRRTADRSAERERMEQTRSPRPPRVDNRSVEKRSPENRRSRSESVRADGIKLASAQFAHQADERLKFYLELASPVVDAPSIGPRMATRLEKLGILTVDQLLAANADSLADKLNMRRVDGAAIRSWQEQARLVCRIPNLRGHDAQLLVACQLTSPEELATMQAASVLNQVLIVADSSEGQRILRGSKQPDLEEVGDWIRWASQCRSLNAA